jgi:hypothetical protein
MLGRVCVVRHDTFPQLYGTQELLGHYRAILCDTSQSPVAGGGRCCGDWCRFHGPFGGSDARETRCPRRRARKPQHRLGSQFSQWRHGSHRHEARRGPTQIQVRPRTNAPNVCGITGINRLRREIVKEEKIDCDFARCGHLEVACKQKHFDAYQRHAELIEVEFNHKLRVVPRTDLGAEIGSTVYYGGMVDELSAGCNPARYVAGLAAGA